MNHAFVCAIWMVGLKLGEDLGSGMLIVALIVTSFGGGSVMVWGGISMFGKIKLVVFAGNLNGTKYRDDILHVLQLIAVPYLQTLGPKFLTPINGRPC